MANKCWLHSTQLVPFSSQVLPTRLFPGAPVCQRHVTEFRPMECSRKWCCNSQASLPTFHSTLPTLCSGAGCSGLGKPWLMLYSHRSTAPTCQGEHQGPCTHPTLVNPCPVDLHPTSGAWVDVPGPSPLQAGLPILPGCLGLVVPSLGSLLPPYSCRPSPASTHSVRKVCRHPL